jgi:oxygen-dependent protoporphyrinogen oxidase
VGGIYTGDPERLSLRATLPRFVDMERAHRSVILATLKKGKPKPGQGTGARYNLFVGLPEGMIGLITALAARLPPGSVRLGTKVESLSREENGAYRLRTPTTEDHFDAVVVALPAFAGATLLEPLDAPLATLLQSIPYASTLVVTSGHRLADSRHPLDAFGLVIPAVERRRVLAISFASRKFAGRAPEGRVLIRTFVGGALQPELADLTDAQAESLVLAELDALLGIRGKPDFIRVMRHARAMPQYEVGHLARIDSIDARLATHPSLTNVALAGNAYRGVGIPDCVHSGERAADRIFTSLTRHAASGDARQSKSDQGARPRA